MTKWALAGVVSVAACGRFGFDATTGGGTDAAGAASDVGDSPNHARIVITAGATSVPAGYSIAVSFDHASLVAAGTSRAMAPTSRSSAMPARSTA
jgi:hypothetical protein